MSRGFDMKKYDVAVVGGCASGITAAINAKRKNPKLNIVIIEKLPRIGKKILATGNGRCNLTNVNAVAEDYCNSDFVSDIFAKYPPQRVIGFFESMGLVTFADSEGRVYPRSNMASSVLDVLRFELEKLGVEILCDTAVTQIKKSNGGFVLNDNIFCKKVLVSTGGKASPSQGSDGSGYALAKQLGHSVTPLCPALVPLTVRDNVRALKGVRARNVSLTLTNGRPLAKTSGELLFTENGISGIAAMELAAEAEKSLISAKGKTFTEIDFVPDMSEKELTVYLKKIKDINGKANIDMFFAGILPKAIGVEICKAISLYKNDRTISQLKEEDIISAARKAKKFRLEVAGTKGFANAQVTSGGVPVSEISSNTMESVICNGLYFAGEITDVDARCGGFNLQWAFASGLLAGENIW